MTISNRYDRQTSILPVEELNKIHILLVGVGALGRPTAMIAAATGFGTIAIVDPDTVEPHNLAAQGYKEGDIGLTKVDALSREVKETNSEINVLSYCRKFDNTMLTRILDSQTDVLLQNRKLVVISCVDSIKVRKEIWEASKKHPNLGLYLDARMMGPIVQVYGAQRGWESFENYPTTLFEESEAFQAPCSARSMIYPCSVAAGLLISHISNWMRNIPVEEYISMNLNDMSTLSMEDRTVPKRTEELVAG